MLLRFVQGASEDFNLISDDKNILKGAFHGKSFLLRIIEKPLHEIIHGVRSLPR